MKCLRLTGCHKVDIHKKTIYPNGEALPLKSIPAIRYSFESYTDTELGYISKIVQDFSASLHIVELTLATSEDRQMLSSVLDYIETNSISAAIYVYIDITEDMVSTKTVPETLRPLLIDLVHTCDRIILRDRSTSLFTDTWDSLRHEVAGLTGFDVEYIGLCGSPLTSGDLPCLTAKQFMCLAAIYCGAVPQISGDSAVSTACTGCSHCLDYLTISEDIPLPQSLSDTGASENTEGCTAVPKAVGSKSSKSTAKKKSKAPLLWL